MKATSLKTAAILAGSISLLAGNAMAQSSTTDVVGYETLDYLAGFTPVGLRLHETPIASGTLETVTVTTAVDDDIDLGALMTGGTFILEIEDGSGIIQEVTASDGGTGLTVADLTGVANGAAYTLRPSATLASVFGATAGETPLVHGNGGPSGSDQLWVADGAGGYNKYYYDDFAPPSFAPSWALVDTSAFGATEVDGATIDLVYADGIVMVTAAAGSLVVTGDLKTAATELNLNAGFNVVSSVSPVGANLVNAYGAGVGLVHGNGGPSGSDQIWMSDGAGGYNKYYYDDFAPPSFAPSWAIVDTSAFGATELDGATIGLASGMVIVSGAGGNVVQEVPSFYAGL